MTSPAAPPPVPGGTSTRPYLIRALHDWCSDNGYTPYIAVYVDARVHVPVEYVKNNEIVLNVGFEATSGLKLGNETIEFKARFGGKSREISVPVDHVVAIYARENGQGMAFPSPAAMATDAPTADAPEAPPVPARTPRLTLTEAGPDTVPDADPAGPSVPEGSGDDSEPPSPPPEPGGRRASLKRIK